MKYRHLFIIFSMFFLCGCSGKAMKDDVVKLERDAETMSQADVRKITVLRSEKKGKIHIPNLEHRSL